MLPEPVLHPVTQGALVSLKFYKKFPSVSSDYVDYILCMDMASAVTILPASSILFSSNGTAFISLLFPDMPLSQVLFLC